jgi:hypothetical protein
MAQRAPSRTPSFAGSVDGNTPNAALLGAALAFGRRQPQTNNAGGTNTAQNAAVAAGQRSRTNSPEGRPATARTASSSTYGSIARQQTGGDSRDTAPVYVRRNLTGISRGAPGLRAPSVDRAPSNSPARSAATVASSRADMTDRQYQPLTREFKPATPPKPRRLSNQHFTPSSKPIDRPTDATPIPPTTSLMGLFESKNKRGEVSRPTKHPSTLSPVRTAPVKVSRDTEQLHDDSSQERSNISASEDTAASPDPAIYERPTAATGLRPPASQQRRLSPSPAWAPYAGTRPIDIKLPPNNMSSTTTMLPPRKLSAQSITATYHQLYPRRSMTPLTTEDTIANAIVASSLASSRANSPGKLEPPSLPPSRRHRHLGMDARTPSPTKKGMRKTLRESDSSSEDSEDELHPYGKHKKKRHLRKHPNKHHEGERKRWREAVTERERKRYEGVWAANRGLHCTLSPSELQSLRRPRDLQTAHDSLRDSISGLVAHDLWLRSRLPDFELEAIWELVDTQARGRLCKEEFVVGMWLIDQRLKGRKLPTKVSATVWASVKGIEGIKVKKFLG